MCEDQASQPISLHFSIYENGTNLGARQNFWKHSLLWLSYTKVTAAALVIPYVTPRKYNLAYFLNFYHKNITVHIF